MGQEWYKTSRFYTFFVERGMPIINWGQDFLHIRESTSIKRVRFVSDGMSYIYIILDIVSVI